MKNNKVLIAFVIGFLSILNTAVSQPFNPGQTLDPGCSPGSLNCSVDLGIVIPPVDSVNTKTGVVVLDTDDISEGTNLYYTEAKVSANSDVTANTNYKNVGHIPLDQKAVVSGVATLDGSGLVPTSQLPALAITNVYTVADETAHFNLTVQEGDVAIRTDESKSYINTTGSNSSIADWSELLTPGTVTSVNGGSGTVSLGIDDLDDTPIALSPNQILQVNTGGTAVDFVDYSFLGLSDTPNDYTSNAKKITFVNLAENAIEFASNLFWDSGTDRLGIGENTPLTTLDLGGSGGGLLRLGDSDTGTTGETDVLGSLAFDYANNKPQYYDGADWTSLGVSNEITNANKDTKIETEQTLGEKIIRFTTDSVQRMILTAGGILGIGTDTPNPKAILDVSSVTKGFLPPRMTEIERNVMSLGMGEEGMTIYNISKNTIQTWSGDRWEEVSPSILNNYANETALINDQGNQIAGGLYRVNTNPPRYYEYSGTIDFDISAYFPVNDGKAVLNNYADETALIADQTNQIEGGLYRLNTNPPQYYEYLGNSNSLITDYDVVQDGKTILRTYLTDFALFGDQANQVSGGIYKSREFGTARYVYLGTTNGNLTDYDLLSHGRETDKAVFQLDSTTKGFLPPRMNDTERDAITGLGVADEGLQIFNTDIKRTQTWDGVAWTETHLFNKDADVNFWVVDNPADGEFFEDDFIILNLTATTYQLKKKSFNPLFTSDRVYYNEYRSNANNQSPTQSLNWVNIDTTNFRNISNAVSLRTGINIVDPLEFSKVDLSFRSNGLPLTYTIWSNNGLIEIKRTIAKTSSKILAGATDFTRKAAYLDLDASQANPSTGLLGGSWSSLPNFSNTIEQVGTLPQFELKKGISYKLTAEFSYLNVASGDECDFAFVDIANLGVVLGTTGGVDGGEHKRSRTARALITPSEDMTVGIEILTSNGTYSILASQNNGGTSIMVEEL